MTLDQYHRKACKFIPEDSDGTAFIAFTDKTAILMKSNDRLYGVVLFYHIMVIRKITTYSIMIHANPNRQFLITRDTDDVLMSFYRNGRWELTDVSPPDPFKGAVTMGEGLEAADAVLKNPDYCIEVPL